MTKLLAIIFIASLAPMAYAQDRDESVIETCNANESCIITSSGSGFEHIIKIISVEDYNRQSVGATLNTRSTIIDSFYEGQNSCYRGKIRDACKMGEMLAGNTNMDYAGGGHFEVSEFNCYALGQSVYFEYLESNDYEPEAKRTTINLNPCR